MNKWMKRFLLALYLPLACNLILTVIFVNRWLSFISLGIILRLDLAAFLAIVFLLSVFWIHIIPVRDRSPVSRRVKIMEGGRQLVYMGLYALFMQGAVFLLAYPTLLFPLRDTWLKRIIWQSGLTGRYTFQASTQVLIINGFVAVIMAFLFLANGVVRIFCTSRRLSILRRVVMVLVMWIPLVNLIVLFYACRLVYEEYDFEKGKALLRELRANTRLCATRYPLLLVHGIGFRDLRYFNYWGRIPRELMRNGATIYYGNQEALGTVAYNAEDIKKRILQMMEETGCEKVNILAHSKGGLDARYAISKLGMAPYVASLTTMNTPHRGCRFVDYACHLPEWLYRFVAGCFDRTFRKFGDKNPDFYTATHQFSTRESEQLNIEMPDAHEVYYQSYTSKMKRPWSHLLLSIPYCMIWPLEGENDGLVSVSSAKWGKFQGVFSNNHTRGISHGDIIDLKREDYKGFDVTEIYVQIVAALKEKGF